MPMNSSTFKPGAAALWSARYAVGAAIVFIALAPTFQPSARAADTSKIPPGIKFAAVKANIADDRWIAAIDELKRMNEPGDADWNNLMGYSHRKAKKPDYDAAERYYDAALQINPQHKGALEYSGEMYLVLGRLDKAEQRLSTLDQLCKTPCFEYVMLKKAVDDYRANGNKLVEPPP